MDLDVNSLPDDPSHLKSIITSLAAEQQRLEEMVRLLQAEIFGRKSEKRPVEDRLQYRLFEPLDEPEAASDKEQDDAGVIVPAHRRRKAVRKPLPADLPRVEVVHDIDEKDKHCGCGSRRERCGEETSEKLVYKPAKFYVERHIRPKYACRVCEGVEDEGPTVKIAPMPPQLIEKSFATASLLAHIVCSKFEDALPLYRQEKIFARLGIDLARSTMCGWLISVYHKLMPLMGLLFAEIRSGPVVNADETPVQVLDEPARANTSKSYMWVFRGGAPDRPGIVFRYHPTRSGDVPLEFLRGYRGYLQCDDYKGYNAVERQDGIVRMGCWAHARRKFDKVIKAGGSKKKQGNAEEALEYIRRLYQVEKQARSRELDADAIADLRARESKPVLEEFKTWLEQKAPLTPPKGLLGKALGYTLNNWQRLIRYVDNGHLRPDNNLAENAIRPFVVGRKNWLFNGSPDGAKASAGYYSLIETAKANGLKPHDYLRHLFENLPLAETEADYRKLLPQHLEADKICLPS